MPASRRILFGTGRGCKSDARSVPDAPRLVRIEAALPCAVRQRLVAALELAFSTLQREPSCREMFEELGHAGATEWPLDPNARRSFEISADVGRRCGLLSGR